MCGGRKDPPAGWGAAESLEGVTCRVETTENDWGWGDENKLPKFHDCLFMRKIADDLAPLVAELSDKILVANN